MESKAKTLLSLIIFIIIIFIVAKLIRRIVFHMKGEIILIILLTLFAQTGEVWIEGDVYTRPKLAKTLKIIAEKVV